MPKAKVIRFPAVQKAREKKGRPEPKPWHWECKRCEHDIGIATTVTIKVRIGPVIKGLRVTGGYMRDVCATCLQRGITTPLIR